MHSLALLSCMCTIMQNSSQQLQQLLRHVADSHRRRVTAALLVGYTMKPSRERNLASRGLLPLTAPHGVCFVPVDFGQPLEQQGPFDVMLHKVIPLPFWDMFINLFINMFIHLFINLFINLFIKAFLSACVFATAETHVRPAAIASAIHLLAQFAVITYRLHPICWCLQHPDGTRLYPQYMHCMS